jgi:hypothetical protein
VNSRNPQNPDSEVVMKVVIRLLVFASSIPDPDPVLDFKLRCLEWGKSAKEEVGCTSG